MDKLQTQVAEFHKAIGHTESPTIDFKDLELRRSLIKEEFEELMEAFDNKDMVEAIDAMVDLKYVIDGAALTFGIDLEPFQDEVHRSNMAKTKGPKREDGKQLKPPGWTPPDIEGLLNQIKKNR